MAYYGEFLFWFSLFGVQYASCICMDVHFPNSCICMDVYFPNLREFDLVEDLAYVIDLEFLFICVSYD